MPHHMVDALCALADEQSLIQQAMKALVSRWGKIGSEDVNWAFTIDELRPELGAQMLCFRSGRTNVRAPYISTNLRLYVFGYHVGWYELLTALDGKVIREDGAILHDYHSDGRAAALIGRARRRPVGARWEWIGLVGLTATPGNSMFPDWALGGFTTALALAADEDEYRRRVEAFFSQLGVEVDEYEDVEPLPERLRVDRPVDDEIFELARTLSDSRPVVHIQTIESYSSEDGEE